MDFDNYIANYVNINLYKDLPKTIYDLKTTIKVENIALVIDLNYYRRTKKIKLL